MFGWKKKYKEALANAEFYMDKSARLGNELAVVDSHRRGYFQEVRRLLIQNAALENRIAALVAELERERRLNSGQFTNDEIKTLTSLCHPDKHGGKESAVRITQKLLKLRG